MFDFDGSAGPLALTPQNAQNQCLTANGNVVAIAGCDAANANQAFTIAGAAASAGGGNVQEDAATGDDNEGNAGNGDEAVVDDGQAGSGNQTDSGNNGGIGRGNGQGNGQGNGRGNGRVRGNGRGRDRGQGGNQATDCAPVRVVTVTEIIEVSAPTAADSAVATETDAAAATETAVATDSEEAPETTAEAATTADETGAASTTDEAAAVTSAQADATTTAAVALDGILTVNPTEAVPVSRAGSTLNPTAAAEAHQFDNTATRAFTGVQIRSPEGQCLFVDPTAGDFRQNLIPVQLVECTGSPNEKFDIVTAGKHNNANGAALIVSSLVGFPIHPSPPI